MPARRQKVVTGGDMVKSLLDLVLWEHWIDDWIAVCWFDRQARDGVVACWGVLVVAFGFWLRTLATTRQWCVRPWYVERNPESGAFFSKNMVFTSFFKLNARKSDNFEFDCHLKILDLNLASEMWRASQLLIKARYHNGWYARVPFAS